MNQQRYPLMIQADTEDQLRYQLWNYHGCDRNARYGDDGELQCNECFSDFKRHSISELLQQIDRAEAVRIVKEKLGPLVQMTDEEINQLIDRLKESFKRKL